MSEQRRGFDRRAFLKSMGYGAAFAVGAGAAARPLGQLLMPSAAAVTTELGLAATDGYITVPGRENDPIYIFGFASVNPATTPNELIPTYKGHSQTTAPHLGFPQEGDVKITLSNLGLIQRPDLTDSHTIHWHGFDLPSPLNDGVPEVSVAVPIGKQLTYFYRPHREGTYMYHCHFEDVEHVHMGMTGIVFVTPTQDGNATLRNVGTTRQPPNNNAPFKGFAYNDGDASTGYDRHFALLLNEVWSVFHDGDRDIQESIPTDYDPQWFTINGRCYPQTVLPNDNSSLPDSQRIATPNPNFDDAPDHSQPNSSLIQVKGGDRVLLRLADLGYQQHAMQLPGIPMHVVGQDASWLGSNGSDYWTNTLYIGPGEARDVLFDAPAYNAARPGGSDAVGAYNVYLFKNRDWRRLSNDGAPGPGGMQTEVRVYASLPAQTTVSQTYPF
ncbi:MAG TPA: multicopper oxidase domain-containing protein [Candidatus Limnocylindrales bacterium]|jgi:FtsP/CotA-like multicopper oxidase with cupredoxin domain|nr:multicopper oxidase domain-containing protein [Candidatus Limnocylindrales bacterium]